MRSWFTGMPGEVVSCIGCHEDPNQIVLPKRVIASRKAPVQLQIPEGGVRSFTFDLEMQPMLDRACIACHTSEGRAFDLQGGTKDQRGFGTAYLNLHPYVHRQGPEAGIKVLYPYEYHANTSELVRLLKKGHYNVQLTDKEWRTLYNWIDYNAPDKGTFQATLHEGFPYQGFDQVQRRIELANKYALESGVDWKQELTDYAAYLKSQGEITPVRPQRSPRAQMQEIQVEDWPFTEPNSPVHNTTKEVALAPGISIKFVYIPAGRFVMGSNTSGLPDVSPASEVEIKKPFWMGEVEITNEQYTALVPEHESRYVDQLWKDHVSQGYPAYLPHQPVIRVSYELAMDYCRKLSEKTGLTFTLPSEAQWEWACRAGSSTSFWFGDLNADFSPYENLADAQLSNMAVSGVDPQPMRRTDSWFPYYNFIPRSESIDDGNMIQGASNMYKPNPFGLYSMHGNIAEWTRSDYLPYPYNENTQDTSPYKVVRGGSYIERPIFSTAYARKAYYPWQRVFNVGFRVILEEPDNFAALRNE
jgi:formylglycine-generating enzyme required for sulfatase activity